jgi:hypothetical protein
VALTDCPAEAVIAFLPLRQGRGISDCFEIDYFSNAPNNLPEVF